MGLVEVLLLRGRVVVVVVRLAVEDVPLLLRGRVAVVLRLAVLVRVAVVRLVVLRVAVARSFVVGTERVAEPLVGVVRVVVVVVVVELPWGLEGRCAWAAGVINSTKRKRMAAVKEYFFIAICFVCDHKYGPNLPCLQLFPSV